MDAAEFKKRGYELIDYIADYLENIRRYKVYPSVKPGYLKAMVPAKAPEKSEDWDKILGDVDRVIIPGLTHWQSPYFHAYYPSVTSYPSILADLLCAGINNVGFTWAASPACTELETQMTDWVGQMIGLPEEFLHGEKGNKLGGGVIQPSISESTLVCMLAARAEAVRRYKEKHGENGVDDGTIMSKLVAYGSDQTHSHFEKDVSIAAVRMNLIETDAPDYNLNGKMLAAAVEKDKAAGLIPFFVCATLGTTGICTFDDITSIAPICKKEGMWLHVDAAYAGATFVCPEFRYLGKGIEQADSFVFNCAKLFLISYECSILWIKNCTYFFRAFNVEPLYLQHENTGLAIDYMHWQLQLSRRFRALKLWFTIRSYGVEGYQKFFRNHVKMGELFEKTILEDGRFEIPCKRHLGLLAFRFKGDDGDVKSELLLKRMNQDGRMHCVPCRVKGKYLIRIVVNHPETSPVDVKRDCDIIFEIATKIEKDLASGKKPKMRYSVCDKDQTKVGRRSSIMAEEGNLRWSATMEGKDECSSKQDSAKKQNDRKDKDGNRSA